MELSDGQQDILAERRAEEHAQIDDWREEARNLGHDAAVDAASWTTDGNSDVQGAARLLGMLNDGDPQAYDYLPATPDLSGEWADAPTPNSLAREVVGDLDFDGLDELVSTIADAFEDGVSEAFTQACEEQLRRFLSPLGEIRETQHGFRLYVDGEAFGSAHNTGDPDDARREADAWEASNVSSLQALLVDNKPVERYRDRYSSGSDDGRWSLSMDEDE